MQNITPDPSRAASGAAQGLGRAARGAVGERVRASLIALPLIALPLTAPIAYERARAEPRGLTRLLSPRESEALNAQLTPRVATVWRIPTLVEGARAPGGGVGVGAAVWLTPQYALTASSWLEPAGFEREVQVRVGCEAAADSARAGRPGDREVALAALAEAALPARVSLALPQEGLALLEVVGAVEGARCPPARLWGERGELTGERAELTGERAELTGERAERLSALQALISGLTLHAAPGEEDERAGDPLGARRLSLTDALAEALSARLSAHLGPLHPTRALYAARPGADRPARLVLEGRGAGPLAFFWLTRAPLAPGLPLFDDAGRLITLAVGGAEGATLPLSARAAFTARLARRWGLE